MATSEILRRERGAIRPTEIYHEVQSVIQASDNIDHIFHVVLTAVTAQYGLRFNNAAIFLYAPGGLQMIGHTGIGHFEKQRAVDDWEADKQDGLDQFKAY